MLNLKLKKITTFISLAFLTACAGMGSHPDVKSPAPPSTSASGTEAGTKSGGYYLDDGPGEDAPTDIDSIPNAQLKIETPLERANKPYSALGMQYTPMTSYKPYKKQGVASWYGKRYHGKQTSSGEVYDMYSMTAAHTTLPIPSYARVTNPSNGRSIIVRINDRGPFKHDRLIDLSYAAAYKLRLAEQGSALVDVEMIDTSSNESIAKALRTTPVKAAANTNTDHTESKANKVTTSKPNVIPTKKSADSPIVNPVAETAPVEVEPIVTAEPLVKPEPIKPTETKAIIPPVVRETAPVNAIPPSKKLASSKLQYYVQAGAFKSEANSLALQKKIQGLTLAGNAELDSVYNDGLYRVKLGPFTSKKDADAAASSINKQLGITAIVKN